MNENELPCCDYRDHVSACCACPDHERSILHPFGSGERETPMSDRHNEYGELLIPEWRYLEMKERVGELNGVIKTQGERVEALVRALELLAGSDYDGYVLQRKLARLISEHKEATE